MHSELSHYECKLGLLTTGSLNHLIELIILKIPANYYMFVYRVRVYLLDPWSVNALFIRT